MEEIMIVILCQVICWLQSVYVIHVVFSNSTYATADTKAAPQSLSNFPNHKYPEPTAGAEMPLMLPSLREARSNRPL